jgi:Tfp pilus assembly protein PilF
MFCSSCGAKNAAESNYCRECGRRVQALATTRISEEEFDRALPEEEQVTALLERAYRRRKEDVGAAIALCKEVLEIRPNSTTAHGLLGQLYEQSGERDLAVAQYERVLQLNPGSIADRVKLDDLRDGRPRPAANRTPVPKVVIVDPNGAPIRGAMLWGVTICALLILSGAAVAVAFGRRDGQPPRESEQAVRAKGGAAQEPSLARTTATGSAPAQSRASTEVTQSPGPASYAPAFTFPAVQVASPPVVYYPAPYSQRPASLPAPAAPRRVQPVATRSEREPSDADSVGSARVHLSVDSVVSDGANGGDGHNPVIKIARRDEGRSPRATANPGPESKSIINITPHKGTADPVAANMPTSDAAATISIGQEKLNKGDYGGAIIAFHKALAGANDETAYIYQQMAQCYQARNENRNAISMYEHARDEYRKLSTAGRQVARANDGIRICETGIKICTNE